MEWRVDGTSLCSQYFKVCKSAWELVIVNQRYLGNRNVERFPTTRNLSQVMVHKLHDVTVDKSAGNFKIRVKHIMVLREAPGPLGGKQQAATQASRE
jgi:hypothetical protein